MVPRLFAPSIGPPVGQSLSEFVGPFVPYPLVSLSVPWLVGFCVSTSVFRSIHWSVCPLIVGLSICLSLAFNWPLGCSVTGPLVGQSVSLGWSLGRLVPHLVGPLFGLSASWLVSFFTALSVPWLGP